MVTACRTAMGTFPLQGFPMDIQPTCIASGEYQSRQGKRYEHMENAMSTLEPTG